MAMNHHYDLLLTQTSMYCSCVVCWTSDFISSVLDNYWSVLQYWNNSIPKYFNFCKYTAYLNTETYRGSITKIVLVRNNIKHHHNINNKNRFLNLELCVYALYVKVIEDWYLCIVSWLTTHAVILLSVRVVHNYTVILMITPAYCHSNIYLYMYI